MTTFARAQENVVDPGAGGIRWFKCYDAVAEFSRGLAYLCKWESANNKWVVDEISGRQYIYSTVSGVTAAANDFVPCLWNTRGRFWEIASKSSTTKCVEWYTPGTRETSVDGIFGAGDTGYVYYQGRYGEADAGIIHDPAEAAPSTNGNFTVTRSGVYRFYLNWSFKRSGTWANNFRTFGSVLYYYRGGGWTIGGSIQNTLYTNAVAITGDFTACSIGLLPLQAEDKLRISAILSSGSGEKAQLMSHAFGIERVGDYVAGVAIP